jgi:hypothetical protein
LLAHAHFEYDYYNEEAGAVVYNLRNGNWTLAVAYGDECYYYLYNGVTQESVTAEFTSVSEVMMAYEKLYHLQPSVSQS